jgi:hypothetical protein
MELKKTFMVCTVHKLQSIVIDPNTVVQEIVPAAESIENMVLMPIGEIQKKVEVQKFIEDNNVTEPFTLIKLFTPIKGE